MGFVNTSSTHYRYDCLSLTKTYELLGWHSPGHNGNLTDAFKIFISTYLEKDSGYGGVVKTACSIKQFVFMFSSQQVTMLHILLLIMYMFFLIHLLPKCVKGRARIENHRGKPHMLDRCRAVVRLRLSSLISFLLTAFFRLKTDIVSAESTVLTIAWIQLRSNP